MSRHFVRCNSHRAIEKVQRLIGRLPECFFAFGSNAHLWEVTEAEAAIIRAAVFPVEAHRHGLRGVTFPRVRIEGATPMYLGRKFGRCWPMG